MTIASIRMMLQEWPFRPFDIHTSDGRVVTVTAPDFAWIHPFGRTMYVCTNPNVDADEVIDLRHVTKLTTGKQQRGRRKK